LLTLLLVTTCPGLAEKGKEDTDMRSTWLTTPEVAARAGISYFRVAQLIQSGRLVPPPQRGGRYVWSEADVQRLIQASRIDRRRADQRQAAAV
jgi:hypothetical protein